jgi:hypothetical protein
LCHFRKGKDDISPTQHKPTTNADAVAPEQNGFENASFEATPEIIYEQQPTLRRQDTGSWLLGCLNHCL